MGHQPSIGKGIKLAARANSQLAERHGRDDENSLNEASQDRTEAEHHFNEIARNLQNASKLSQGANVVEGSNSGANNIFIRKGSSHYTAGNSTNVKASKEASVSASHYGASSIQNSKELAAGVPSNAADGSGVPGASGKSR